MQRRIVQFTVVAVVCAVAGGAVLAADTIADDYAEGYALVSGTVSFVGDSDWTGYVDYAVYAPDEYTSLGDHPDEETKYIYAYQIFNDSTSTVTVSHLSIGLASDAGADNVWYDTTYGESGGSIPVLSWLVGNPPGSVQWVGSWAPGTHSTVLLFSSPNNYTWDSATMANGGKGDTHDLPSPLPEPAVLILLCGGIVPMLLKHRRKARARA